MSVSSNISDEYKGNILCANDVSVLWLWTAKHYMLSLVSHAVIFVWGYCRHMCHVSQKLSSSAGMKYMNKIFMLPTFFSQTWLWACLISNIFLAVKINLCFQLCSFYRGHLGFLFTLLFVSFLVSFSCYLQSLSCPVFSDVSRILHYLLCFIFTSNENIGILLDFWPLVKIFETKGGCTRRGSAINSRAMLPVAS